MTPALPIAVSRRQRGSAYVLVLSVAMIVTAIGLSALMAARIQTRVVMNEQYAVRARVTAQSALEVLVHRLSNSATWRTAHTHDVWSADEAWGDVTVSYKLVDDAGNANLNADPLAPVRLHAKASLDNTARVYSVQLQPIPPTVSNLLSNPGAESGSSSWSASGAELQLRTNDNPRGGVNHFRIQNRIAQWAGPLQNVTSQMSSSGSPFYAEVWVRMEDNADAVRITMTTRNTLGMDRVFNGPSTTVGTNWTRVTATLSPTWSGSLSQALIRIETVSSTQEMHMDDALMIAGSNPPLTILKAVAGTLRQETLP